jgi:hypothetical protein
VSEAIDLLRSIDASLKRLVGQQTATRPKAAASDRDLDGTHGDPVIKAKDPRDWTGPSMTGRKLSECPPDYLDLWADRMDWFASQADEKGETASNGKPVAVYKRLDAARARGWAERIRSGRHVQTTPVEPNVAWVPDSADDGGFVATDDDIPF